MIAISLPWPPSSLSPNARSLTWHKAAAAKKKYRHACAWSAVAQGARRMAADSLDVRITFYPPDRRPRDRDNMIASLKAGQDGIVDAIGVDDAKWVTTYVVAEPVDGGSVVVEIAR